MIKRFMTDLWILWLNFYRLLFSVIRKILKNNFHTLKLKVIIMVTTNKYDDLFPETNDPELKTLFEKIKIYLARCDGIIKDSNSNIVVKRDDMRTFNPYLLPKSRPIYDTIIYRLKMIKKYRITDPEQVWRLLSLDFAREKRLKKNERKFLEAFVTYPDKTYTEIARFLGVTPAAVLYNLKKFKEKFGLRFVSLFDYTKFKLRNYVIFVKFKHLYDKRTVFKILENPSLTTFNFDTFSSGGERWGWIGFVVPDQKRVLKDFKDSITELEGILFNELRIYEIRGMGHGWNFERFDNKHWFFQEDMWVYGLLNFVEKYEDILPQPDIFSFSYETTPFDNIDFLIFLFKIVDYKISYKKLRGLLQEQGYNLSITQIGERVKKLKSFNVWKPYVDLIGLGLSEVLTVNVECNESTREILLKALPEFPRYAVSVHDRGLLFMLFLPHGYGERFAYLFDDFRDHVNDMLIIRRFTNIGSWLPIKMHKMWNAKRRFWDLGKNYFNFYEKLKSFT